jgi:hypothetical protein
MVEHGGHHPCGQSALSKSPQRVEERMQLRLLFLDDAI